MKVSFQIGFILISPFTTAIPFRRYHNIYKNEAAKKITANLRQECILKNSLVTRGGADALEMSTEAFEWCANLGAPAALVGGAVLATLSETREFLAPRKQDSRRIRISKQLTRLLLLSAFALELISIFATTVTGTMLLTEGDRGQSGTELMNKSYNSPMGFMYDNHPFEYLCARITFLQGLLNWLVAIALEISIPKPGEGESSKRMNSFICSSLVTVIFLMLSFYNAHMTYFDNYLGMLSAFGKLIFQRYIQQWPPRPMAILYIPSLLYTIRAGFRAFTSDPELDED